MNTPSWVYLNLLQIGRKQTKVEVAQKKRLRQQTKHSIQYINNDLQQLKEIAMFVI